nr:DUF3857 domain-containing protein [Gammaproteobacteria bacterium]
LVWTCPNSRNAIKVAKSYDLLPSTSEVRTSRGTSVTVNFIKINSPTLRHIALTLSVLFSLCNQATAFDDNASDAYQIRAVPDWVVSPDVYQSPRQTQAYDGNNLRYRLYNNQVNILGESSEYYFEFVYELKNRSAVEENAQLEIEFDPSYEQLHLHRIAIVRDGIEIDKLATSTYQLMQRERGLEQLIYDGTQTLAVILNDVRVGDTVSYSYSLVGDNPIFSGVREFGFNTDYGIPVDRLYMRVLANQNNALNIRKVNTDAEVLIAESGDSTQYIIDLKEVQEFVEEDNVPSWRSRYGSVVFSEIENWDEVVDWAKPMYSLEGLELKEVDKLAEDIRSSYPDPMEQVGAALDWVQNEVRYFGVEMGVNSHKPSPPAQTLARRFGDCKDKSLLLIALLDALGMSSAPALVNSDRGLENPNYPWRMHAFDHVIVHLSLNGRSYWLDPTDGYQKGKLGEFSEPNFGRALILDNQSLDLSEMDSAGALRKKIIAKTLSIPTGENPLVKFSIATDHYKSAAESIRYQLEDTGVYSLSDSYTEYYQDYFDDLSGRSTLGVEEKSANVLVTNEEYGIESFWMAEGEFEKYQWLYADEIQEYLTAPEQVDRSNALQVNHPIKIEETWVVKAPHRLHIDDVDGVEDNEFFSLVKSHEYDHSNHTLKVIFKYESKSEEVSAANLSRYHDAILRADELAAFYIEDRGENYVPYVESQEDLTVNSFLSTFRQELSTFDLINIIASFVGIIGIGVALLIRLILQRRSDSEA